MDTPCIFSTHNLDADGYPRTKGTRLSRYLYEQKVGPIPAGHDIDHLCHNEDLTCAGGVSCPHRRCINVAHLEPVTRRENTLRGRSFAAVNARKTHCPQGHPYDEANTYVLVEATKTRRCCRACNRAAQRRIAARKKAS